MKKRNFLSIIIYIIIFFIFNVIAFLIPTIKSTTFWIAYSFTILTFLLQPFVWKIVFSNEETIKNKFFEIPIIVISTYCFITQLIVFIFFIFFLLIPYWITLIIESLIMGTAIILLILTIIGKDVIKEIDINNKINISKIDEWKLEIEMLMLEEQDIEKKNSLEKLAEIIKYSDPISNNDLIDLENEISEKIKILKDKINQDIIEETKLLLIKRNKTNKFKKI